MPSRMRIRIASLRLERHVAKPVHPLSFCAHYFLTEYDPVRLDRMNVAGPHFNDFIPRFRHRNSWVTQIARIPDRPII